MREQTPWPSYCKVTASPRRRGEWAFVGNNRGRKPQNAIDSKKDFPSRSSGRRCHFQCFRGAGRANQIYPLLQRESLLTLLSAHTQPSVYRRRDKWVVARDPVKFSAAELASDSFLVMEKPR